MRPRRQPSAIGDEAELACDKAMISMPGAIPAQRHPLISGPFRDGNEFSFQAHFASVISI